MINIKILLLALKLITLQGEDISLLYKNSIITHHIKTTSLDTLFIIKSDSVFIPSTCGRFFIIEISEKELSGFAKKINKPFYAMMAKYYVNKDNTIDIVIRDFSIHNDKSGTLMMGNFGGEKFTYRFNKRTGKYRLIKKFYFENQ